MVAAATITAGIAKADPVVDSYTLNNEARVCKTLDAYPSVAGVEGVIAAIVNEGLTGGQAGQVVGMSVIDFCPSHLPEVQAFADKWAPRRQLA
jgi:hypothetical protein